ncbi:membrane protein [Rhodoblastus acidophilus]|uniref:YihY/virulence factor BrkB family protein n=1 Tax=Rhodoblastus acidophilus TaxID=1074 RepID=UPI002224C223|nr:YihY/virulence factor BrkB family protein [Rhodoblastus acidophilus]MCW2285221.1 membrane protein [Rhodoblastus acidophilus]MCW2334177.1 membrane protein [Rhodoblastus acidophilus]
MRDIWRLLLESLKNFDGDDGYAMSSHIALQGLTAIFPFLIFVTSLAGFLGAKFVASDAAGAFFEIWPPQVAGPILHEIERVLNARHGGLLTLSAALAVYFSSSGVEALRTGLNRAYGLKETRPWWLLRLESVGYVIIGALALLALTLLLVLGPVIWAGALKFAPGLEPLTHLVALARYGVATIILVTALLVAHRVLPNAHIPLRDCAPGIILTLAAWMIFATAFSAYLQRFALNYVATYAGLASVMIAIVFLYALGAIFIYGAELNEALRARKSVKGRDQSPAP